VKLFDFLATLSEQVRETMGSAAIRAIITPIIELIVEGLSQGTSLSCEFDDIVVIL